MVSATRDLCCLRSLPRSLLDAEGACLSLWPCCYSGALMYVGVCLCVFRSSCVCMLILCLCSCLCFVLFEGACLSLWSRFCSGALMYGCFRVFLSVSSCCVCIPTLCFCARICLVLSFSLFFCLLSICVLCPGLTYLEIPTGASLS